MGERVAEAGRQKKSHMPEERTSHEADLGHRRGRKHIFNRTYVHLRACVRACARAYMHACFSVCVCARARARAYEETGAEGDRL